MADTILLTGISGFLAKHVALALLDAGHSLRGTLRRMDRAGEVRAALAPALKDPAALDRLSFAACDLTADAGWDAAMAGVTAVVHTASPFPIVQPADADTLIGPAVEGTRRVLAAAARAGVRRVVLTSSTVAVLAKGRERVQTEDDWADTGPQASAYGRSKTLAERLAWDIAAREGLALTVINPGFIAGPPLDRHFGSSIGLIRRILAGRDPMLPALGLPVVDVRDVALAHLRALERPQTAGQRFLTVAGSMWMPEMGRALKAAYPARRIPTRTAPAALLRILAFFDREARAALPELGHIPQVSNLRAREGLGIDFIPPAEAVVATGTWLIAAKIV